MTGLERSLKAIVSFLESRKVPYMVIGGIANLVWGVPRSTLDIDVTVWAAKDREEALIRELAAEFVSLAEDPASFAAETRVLPLRVMDFRVDILFGGLPYEERAIRRAKTVELAGCSARVCSPEDLVIHKIISERPRDQEDVRGIIRSVGKKLDRTYLEPIVQGLAQDLSRPGILEFYRVELEKILK